MTPIVKFDSVYFKREDQNLTGSAKDRAIAAQLDRLQKLNYSSAVISSTGNAAISADYFCHQKNIPLTVFVSPGINPQKLALIKHSKIFTTPKPISEAFRFSKTNQSYLLRQSTDPAALIGYQEIGSEIMAQLPQVTSIFIPVGSGTTLLGISQKLADSVKIFAVQPANNCPIASFFDQNYQPEKESLTDSLTVKLLPLKSQVITAIKNSSGSGIVINNHQIEDASAFFDINNLSTSPEGVMAFAGYKKALEKYDPGLYPLILLTGTKR